VGSINSVRTDKPLIALTFDDGPDPEVTPRILRLLHRFHAHATFFMIGETAEQYPDVVRMVSDSGHAIGNHSWDHKRFPVLARKDRLAQIRNTEMALQPHFQKLFRPPFGEQNIASRLDALLLGYEVIGWSVHAYDWCERDPSTIYTHLLDNVAPGCIVLLHDRLHEKKYTGALPFNDIVVDREPMLEALERFLDHINGTHTAVTVPELIRSGMPYRTLWFHKDTRSKTTLAVKG
jgi:peptidoglycan/xylan/chitin deacetylase (PgdA/CDA1 family)